MKVKRQYVRVFIFFSSMAMALGAHAVVWEVRDATPTASQVTMTFIQSNRSVTGVMLINFMPQLSCLPEVSFLLIEGDSRRLGKPKAQQWAKSKMTIWIDGSKSWNERTAIESYENGFGVSGMANNTFLHGIMAGREAIIEPLEGTQKFTFTLEGARKAIIQAEAHCMRES
jgi:hypothetical protein